MNEQKNILIIGAGKAGRILSKNISQHHPSLRVIGFIDDSTSKKTAAPILGTVEDIPRLLQTLKIHEIIIAIPSSDGSLVRKILLSNLDNTIPIRMVPRSQNVITKSTVNYDSLKSIESEDFLGRPFIKQGVENLKKFYKGKIVFITGGAGSIGSEIVRQLLDLEVKKVIVYDNSEYLLFLLEQDLKVRGTLKKCELIVGNILYSSKQESLLITKKPDIVFHAAAYKHVHLMNENVDQAIYNNVIGTKRLIEAALKAKVKIFTFISTDKVVNPTSVMGATKKLCEYYIKNIRSKTTHFNIVRFGNVINSNGSALPLFERQMKLHSYVTVTHKKMERFFMSIREAAQLVIKSTAAKNVKSSIFILNMGELINIYDVARCLIRSQNLRPEKDIEVKITGLRKGEKLIEELYTTSEKEKMKKVKTEDIYLLSNLDECREDIEVAIKKFEEMIKDSVPPVRLKRKLKEIFPSIKN